MLEVTIEPWIGGAPKRFGWEQDKQDQSVEQAVLTAILGWLSRGAACMVWCREQRFEQQLRAVVARLEGAEHPLCVPKLVTGGS